MRLLNPVKKLQQNSASKGNMPAHQCKFSSDVKDINIKFMGEIEKVNKWINGFSHNVKELKRSIYMLISAMSMGDRGASTPSTHTLFHEPNHSTKFCFSSDFMQKMKLMCWSWRWGY